MKNYAILTDKDGIEWTIGKTTSAMITIHPTNVNSDDSITAWQMPLKRFIHLIDSGHFESIKNTNYEKEAASKSAVQKAWTQMFGDPLNRI